jgi:hypothetical protein
MADNPQVRAGTAGGTITVAADEVTIYGSAAQIQGMKIHDGLESGTIGARVTSSGELVTVQMNSGTVSVTGTPNVHVTNSGTVSVTGTPNVHLTNSSTVNGGTILGQMGTVNINGTPNVHVTNAATVIANGGTLLGQAGTVTALQGTNPWLVNAWLLAAATATLTGTNPVFVTNNGTVNGGTLLGHMGTVHANIANNGTVSVTGTPNVHVTNAATVTANSGTLLGHMGTVHANIANNGTVTLTGTNPVFVTNSGTVSVSNLGKAEDSAHNSGDTGIMALAVANTAGTAFAADGDYVPLSVDSSGAVRVTGGGGGVQYTEGDTDTTITGTAMLAEGPSDALQALQVDAAKLLQVDIAADSVGIGGGVQYVEDVAHVTGGTGTMGLAVRKNVAAALADTDSDYIPLITDDVGALWTHVNAGTVAVSGLPNVHVTNSATVTLTGTNPVFQTNNGTVNGGTLLGHMGTIHANIANNGTVTLTGTNPVFITNNGTVNGGTLLGHMGTVHANIANNGTVTLTGTNPVFVTNNGTVAALPGGITGFAEDAGHTTGDVGIMSLAVRKNVPAALAGADPDYTPLISDDVGAVWAHVNDGTVAVKGNVLVGNNGTVSVTGTPNVHVTNSSTVIQGTNPWLVNAWLLSAATVTLTGTNPVFQTNNGTVSVTGTPNVHVTNAATVTATDLDIRNLTITNDSITMGSATIGLGYMLGGTNILLTASGTVIPSVASRSLYVVHEALTCQGGTLTLTARNGDGGGTLWGPMQFSPTGGMAVAADIQSGGLYETASGSAVYYEIAGSGTVGGRIRWARLAS